MCFCSAILDLRISKSDFLDLTPYDFTSLMEYNGKIRKSDFELLRNTVYNAGANLMRGKGEKETPLFSEDATTETEDEETIQKERESFFGKKSV